VVGLSAAGFLRRNKFYLLTATAAFTLAFWTGSRGAILAPFAGFLLCTFLFREFRSPRAWLLFLLVGMAGLTFAFGLDALVPMGSHGPDSIARTGSSGRMELWQYTIHEFLERPWLGHGEGQFRFSHSGYIVVQPHNVVLQVLYTWGLIGALLCLGLALWAAPRYLQKDTELEAAPFRCGTIMIVIHAMIDGTLYHVHSTSLFALCCAAAIGARLPRGAEDQRR
jgi:O-antigen ligase